MVDEFVVVLQDEEAPGWLMKMGLPKSMLEHNNDLQTVVGEDDYLVEIEDLEDVLQMGCCPRC